METYINGNKVMFCGIEYDLASMTNQQLDILMEKIATRQAELKVRINRFL